jgi:hypothetical protein
MLIFSDHFTLKSGNFIGQSDRLDNLSTKWVNDHIFQAFFLLCLLISVCSIGCILLVWHGLNQRKRSESSLALSSIAVLLTVASIWRTRQYILNDDHHNDPSMPVYAIVLTLLALHMLFSLFVLSMRKWCRIQYLFIYRI